MNKKLIVFNWKMNPNSLNEAERLFDSVLNFKSYILYYKIIVAAPFIYLSDLKSKVSAFIKNHNELHLASQNCFWEEKGAYTGEISPKMLKNLGIEYAIIGHSERRKYLNETDEIINKKVEAALKAGLKVILCVGESKKSIKYQTLNIKAAKNYIKKQLEKNLKGLSLNSKFYILNSRLIIAYEPQWAISSNVGSCPSAPQDALEMIKFIKQILSVVLHAPYVKVLYGGSVNSENIKNFIQHKEIDGVLIGGASLKTKEVEKIIKLSL